MVERDGQHVAADGGRLHAGAGPALVVAGRAARRIQSNGGWRHRRRGSRSRVKAVVDSQEMFAGLQSGIAYWEGAVDINGTRDGRRVAGKGYVEMTGYSGRAIGEWLGSVR